MIRQWKQTYAEGLKRYSLPKIFLSKLKNVSNFIFFITHFFYKRLHLYSLHPPQIPTWQTVDGHTNNQTLLGVNYDWEGTYRHPSCLCLDVWKKKNPNTNCRFLHSSIMFFFYLNLNFFIQNYWSARKQLTFN